MRRVLGLFLMIGAFLLIGPELVRADEQDELTKLFMDNIELDKVEEAAEDYLPEKMDFAGLVEALIYGEDNRSALEIIGEYIKDMFFYELSNGKVLFIQVISFALLFSVCNRFIVVSNNYVTDMSFLMIYAAMMTLLLETFSMIGETVVGGINSMLSFMSALIPTYAATLFISGNATSASVFYTFTFGIIYCLEWLLRVCVIPGINAYVLLEFLNHIYREERFSKLAALIYKGINYLLKTGLAVVIGIGLVQSMLAPAKDRISDSMILKTFSSIPGVGQITGNAGEIILGCGMLIKNSIGVAALVVLLFAISIPFIKVLVFNLAYHLLAAILQPFADTRIVEGINGIAKGGSLYMKLLTHGFLLFFITIALACTTTSFIH